jgi:hypothetical protein
VSNLSLYTPPLPPLRVCCRARAQRCDAAKQRLLTDVWAFLRHTLLSKVYPLSNWPVSAEKSMERLCCQYQLWYEHDSISVLYNIWWRGMEGSHCLGTYS